MSLKFLPTNECDCDANDERIEFGATGSYVQDYITSVEPARFTGHLIPTTDDAVNRGNSIMVCPFCRTAAPIQRMYVMDKSADDFDCGGCVVCPVGGDVYCPGHQILANFICEECVRRSLAGGWPTLDGSNVVAWLDVLRYVAEEQ